MSKGLGAFLICVYLLVSISSAAETAGRSERKLNKKALGVRPANWRGKPFAALTPTCRKLLFNRLRYPGNMVPIAGNPHRFKLPVRGSPAAMLCVPQKNGNRYWAGLSYAAVNRKAAAAMVNRDIKRLKTATSYSPTAAWLVARNPYVRALSLYLDKVTANCTVVRSFDCNHTIFTVNRHDHGKIERPPRNVTFQGYMEYVEQQHRKLGSLCKVPYTNHACAQVAGCHGYRGPTFIIKTEQQDFWYPCMVKLLGVQMAVSTGWEQFTGGSPCFHRSRGGSCGDALQLPTEASIAQAMDSVNIPMEGTVHTTSAWSKLKEYYTPKAAEIVTRLYASDIALLKYPTWDGVGEFLVDYPPPL